MSKRLFHSGFLIGSLFLSLVILGFSAFGFSTARQEEPRGRTDKRAQAERTADLFIKRFRETLDFGTAFNELSASDAIQRIRRTDVIQGMNLSRKLSKEIDDETARRVYNAFMNFVYLKGVYDLSVDPTTQCKTESGFPIHPEIQAYIKASPYYEWLSDEGGVEDKLPPVSTREELEKYISALNQLTALYKKHLPENVFESPRYLANVKQLEKRRKDPSYVSHGNESLGVERSVDVVNIDRDIFQMLLFEEGGQMKILAFILQH